MCRATPGPKVEGRMHAVERALQEAEETEWRRTNPEARARAEGLTGQLQAAVDKLRGQIEHGPRGGQQRQGRQARAGARGPPGAAGPGAEGPAGVRRLTPSRQPRTQEGLPYVAYGSPSTCVGLSHGPDASYGLRAEVTRYTS